MLLAICRSSPVQPLPAQMYTAVLVKMTKTSLELREDAERSTCTALVSWGKVPRTWSMYLSPGPSILCSPGFHPAFPPWTNKKKIYWCSRTTRMGQLSRVVKASDLGAECPRFKPWQRHLVQLSLPSERWRGGHGNRVGTKLSVETQVVKAENTIFVGHCVIPLGKGIVPHCSVVWMGL